jgi:hypothetical protein
MIRPVHAHNCGSPPKKPRFPVLPNGDMFRVKRVLLPFEFSTSWELAGGLRSFVLISYLNCFAPLDISSPRTDMETFRVFLSLLSAGGTIKIELVSLSKNNVGYRHKKSSIFYVIYLFLSSKTLITN